MFFNLKISKSFIAAVLLFVFLALSCAAYSGVQPASAVYNQKSITLPIIMYHSLLKDKNLQGNYVISPDVFKSDVKYLKENGYKIIGTKELIEYSEGRLDLPEKSVMLTFDDGYYNNYIYAYQIAKEENIKFVLSTIVINTDASDDCEHLSPSYSHCTWSQLKEMISSGNVELMSHTYNLHQNTKRTGITRLPEESEESYKKLLTADLSKANERFSKELGITPAGFTYPFGAVCSEADEVVREMGFKVSFTCEEKLNTITAGNKSSLYNLGRYLRTGSKSSKEFFADILPAENK